MKDFMEEKITLEIDAHNKAIKLIKTALNEIYSYNSTREANTCIERLHEAEMWCNRALTRIKIETNR